MSKVVVINSNQQLDSLINSHTVLVIDFHAVWCGPCKLVAPVYEKLAETLTKPGNMAFVKCDVDQAQEVAAKYDVTAMPTFIVFKNQKEVQRVQGANIQALNAAVMNLAREAEAMQGASGSASGGFGSGQGSTSGGVWSGAPVAKGYQDIAEEIEKKALDIMNANTEVGSARVLFESTQPGKDPKARDWVESDTDEQLMIYIPFQSTLKLHSIHITSLPPYSDDDDKVKRPRTLKLYANRPTIVGFEEAEGMIPTQKVTLTADDWDKETGTAVINTKFVKFQSVFSLTIFVFEGEDDCDRVRIDRIKFVGEPREKREPGKLEKVGEGQE